MKKLLLLSFLISAHFLAAAGHDRINPLLGDQSYLLKYGTAPTAETPDQVRIAAHLEYAEFVLRSKDVSGMTQEQIQKRTHLLDLLHEYRTRGIFPHNFDDADNRRPCFIDRNGTICAVGYLVEQTAGHDVAELINSRFMYNEILEMNDPVVINWIESSGLTREECAIIQPSYREFTPRVSRLSYGVSYRVNDYFYHSIRLQHEKSTRRHGYGGIGAQLDLFGAGDFSTGIRYAKRMGTWRNSAPGWWLSIMPELFRCSRAYGMNLKPELEYMRTWKKFSVGLGYGYCIPVVNEPAYTPGRHDFFLRVGYDLNGIRWKKIRRKTNEDPAGGGAAWKDA
jgi:hypothetical protein